MMRSAQLLRRGRIGLVVAVLIGFAALSLWHGLHIAWSDASTLPARWILSQWRDVQNTRPSLTLWTRTRDDLLSAVQLTPDNPQLREDLAYWYASRAQAMGWPKMGSEEEALRQNLLTDAINNYRVASTLRPTFPYSWTYIALAKHLQGNQDAEFWHAFDKALQYGIYEAGVQPTLAQLAFAQGNSLNPQRQRLILTMFTSSQGVPRQRLAALIKKNGVIVPGF